MGLILHLADSSQIITCFLKQYINNTLTLCPRNISEQETNSSSRPRATGGGVDVILCLKGPTVKSKGEEKTTSDESRMDSELS